MHVLYNISKLYMLLQAYLHALVTLIGATNSIFISGWVVFMNWMLSAGTKNTCMRN